MLALATRGKLHPPTTRFGVAFLGTESRTTIHRARHELGYVPRVDLNEGVRLAAAWYLGRDTQQGSASIAPLTREAVS